MSLAVLQSISRNCSSSHSTSCHSLALEVNCYPECLANVKQNICNIVRFRVVLTTYPIKYVRLTVRLRGKRVQKKRLHAFKACILDENVPNTSVLSPRVFAPLRAITRGSRLSDTTWQYTTWVSCLVNRTIQVTSFTQLHVISFELELQPLTGQSF